MTQDPYILITADTHGGGSHGQYREYLDPQWREAFDEWRGGYKNPSQEHYGSKKMRNWDYGIRNRDQDSQGVVSRWCFRILCRRSIAKASSLPIHRKPTTISAAWPASVPTIAG